MDLEVVEPTSAWPFGRVVLRSLCSPSSVCCSTHKRGIGEPRCDMTLPGAIYLYRSGLRQSCGKGVHRLHPTCHPFGFVDDLVDLTLDDEVHGSPHVEVAVAGVQPDVDALVGIGVGK